MRVRIWTLVAVVALFGVGRSTALIAAQSEKGEKVVKDGSVVSLQYTLTGEDGKAIESNKGKEPLKYVQGQHQIVPGLEREIAGMKVGGEKHVKVKPEDGYGPVNPNAFQDVPKEKIPADMLKELKVGTMLQARTPSGQVIPLRVHEIKEKSVVMDGNHPLAGKTLVFDVKVLDIQSVPPPAPKSSPAPAASPQPANPAQPGPPK